MKNKPDASWFHWSDGRSFTKPEWRKFAFTLKRVKKLPGESFRQKFERCRAAIEDYEAAQKSIVIKEPGLIARVSAFLLGKHPKQVMMLKTRIAGGK